MECHCIGIVFSHAFNNGVLDVYYVDLRRIYVQYWSMSRHIVCNMSLLGRGNSFITIFTTWIHPICNEILLRKGFPHGTDLAVAFLLQSESVASLNFNAKFNPKDSYKILPDLWNSAVSLTEQNPSIAFAPKNWPGLLRAQARQSAGHLRETWAKSWQLL